MSFHGEKAQSTLPAPSPPPSPQTTRHRLFRAFCIAALILFSLTISARRMFAWNFAHHRAYDMIASRPLTASSSPTDLSQNTPPGPSPADGTVLRCVSGEEWHITSNPIRFDYHRSVTTSFELDVYPDDSLFFLARGSLASGQITVVTSPNVNVVTVNVTATYLSRRSLDQAKICHLKRGRNDQGVGIYTPVHPYPGGSRTLQFKVVVSLPVPNGGPRFRAKGLSTDMPLFEHRIGDLENSAIFQSLDLWTKNAAIDVVSMYADFATLRTLNAPIHGNFNVSKSLNIHSSNAAVKADVTLHNEDEIRPTELDVTTTNSPVDLIVGLLRGASSDEHTGGRFKVSARTSNGPLELAVPIAPLESDLHLSARTSNSPAHVALPAAFEGSFTVATNLFVPALEQRDVRDPAGLGRRRVVEERKVRRGLMEGVVHWGERDESSLRSIVDMSNSNAPLTLTL